MRFDKKSFAVILIIISVFRLWYIWYGAIELVPDEAHYWEWSRRLGLSYYSKGPVVAYIIAMFTWIGGNNEASVRIGAVIISAVSSFLLYLIARDIFRSERAGFFAGLLPAITPLYSAGSVLMTTDAPLMLFWGLTLYCLRKALWTGRQACWYAAGVFIGFGFLSKYTMLLILPCIALYLILSKEDRFWFKRKEPYLAAVISLFVASPVIIWNIRNGWVTVRHTMGQAHAGTTLTLSAQAALEFIGAQLGLITPFIFIAVAYAVYRIAVDGLKFGKRDYLLLSCACVPVFMFFLLKSVQAKVQANWPAPAYFAAFAAAGVYDGIYAGFREGARVWFRRGLVLTVAVGLLAAAVVYFPSLLKYAGVTNMEAKAPLNRIIGWREVGARVGAVYEGMKKEGDTFVVSDTYQTASELAFYIPGNPAVYNANLGNRRMNQYDIWGGMDLLIGQNALYVKGSGAGTDLIVENAFDMCKSEPIFGVYRNSLLVREISMFRCYNFKGIEGGGIRTY